MKPQPSQTVDPCMILSQSNTQYQLLEVNCVHVLLEVNCVHVLTSEGLRVREIMSERSCQLVTEVDHT